jgi:hypothetical protein
MKKTTLRLGLSLMIALCLWANRLPAQVIVPAQPDAHIFVVPVVPYEPSYHAPLPAPFAPPPAPGQGPHRISHLLNQHGLACQSNARWGSCGNLHYDCDFIFGSCRTFFGERCYPNIYHGKHGDGWLGNGWVGAGCANGGCQR